MAQPVLALGATLVTAAGCVWYLPALAEVRAGADRPDSRRHAAAACLSGWTTVAGVAVLLLVARTWWPPVAVAGSGAAVTAGLWIRVAVQRRREVRETLRDWATLGQAPPRPARHHCAPLFVTLLCVGLAAASGSAVLMTAGGIGSGRTWALLAAPAGLTGLFLAVAIGWAGPARRGARERSEHRHRDRHRDRHRHRDWHRDRHR
ncbi:hypothetical protein [Streptomyces sp. NPDC048737]|uniref:hypothetical protein n=1 Tax=unclassified Streptomyces TaxID=2593676 RepID=UPI00344161CA